MELIEGSEMSANHNRMPGKYPKEYIQDSKHGESLKSRNIFILSYHMLKNIKMGVDKGYIKFVGVKADPEG